MTKSTQKRWFVGAIILGTAALVISGDFAIGVAVFALLLVPMLITVYIRYAKDNPKKLWFKRKLYGWGWTPVTWQGWLATILYVAIVVACAATLDDDSSAREIALIFVLPFVLTTAAFLRIAYKHGEKPGWQWGPDDEKER